MHTHRRTSQEGKRERNEIKRRILNQAGRLLLRVIEGKPHDERQDGEMEGNEKYI